MLVVGPLAALGVCALVDVGPGGEARASLFPAAVVLLDPFVWTSLRQSAITAGIASLAAIVGGTIVGRVVGRPGGASRAAAMVALGIAAASPPYLIALGASGWLDAGDSATWRARFPSIDAAWAAWVAASVVPGMALGALAYLRALDGLGPWWREAAAMAGGPRLGRWRRLAWPPIRPAMARAGAFTFALTLADPGPPLLLGLRRTLGYQMVVVATGDAPFPALASLALIAVATVAGWRIILRLWSGPDREGNGRDDRPRPPASWRRALATWGVAAGFGAFVLAAMVGLGMVAGEAADEGGATRRLSADPAVTRILVRSLAMGVGVAVLATASGAALARLEASAGLAAAGRFRRLAKAVAPPPIVAGVVVLALGRLATLASAGREDAGALIDWLDADRAPMVATTLAVWLAVASSRVGRRPLGPVDAAHDARYDAAMLAGARRGSARRLARGGRLGEGWGDFAATLATAAVAVAPAMVVVSWLSIATVGPGVLLYRERGGAGAAVAATLGLLAWGVALATAPIGAGRRGNASTADSPGA